MLLGKNLPEFSGINIALKSGLPVTITTSDETKIRIDGETAAALAPGRVTLTATQSGDDNYAASKPMMRTLVVR